MVYKKKRVIRKNNIYKGGDNEEHHNWDMHKLSLFYGTIIIGYFGSKIFMGFYKIYSNKNHNQEIQDFNSLIVLSLLTYIFTDMNSRHVFGDKHNTNISFFVGYIIGLNYPAIKYSINGLNDNGNSTAYKALTIFFYTLVVSLVLIMIFFGTNTLNSNQDGNSSSNITVSKYIIFIVVIILLVWGIVYTRKRSTVYTKYERVDNNRNSDIIKVKTSGYKPSLDASAFSWLITLLFMFDVQEGMMKLFLSILNGVVLGIFVSSLSMDGIKYILTPIDEIKCNTNDKKDCINKGLEIDSVTEEDKIVNINRSIKNNVSTLKWLSGVVISILILIIILFFYNKATN